MGGGGGGSEDEGSIVRSGDRQGEEVVGEEMGMGRRKTMEQWAEVCSPAHTCPSGVLINLVIWPWSVRRLLGFSWSYLFLWRNVQFCPSQFVADGKYSFYGFQSLKLLFFCRTG